MFTMFVHMACLVGISGCNLELQAENREDYSEKWRVTYASQNSHLSVLHLAMLPLHLSS